LGRRSSRWWTTRSTLETDLTVQRHREVRHDLGVLAEKGSAGRPDDGSAHRSLRRDEALDTVRSQATTEVRVKEHHAANGGQRA
jgi:hypothetical protein